MLDGEGRGSTQRKLTQEEIDSLYSRWEDTEYTTQMWNMITQGDIDQLKEVLELSPIAAYVRSSDGRGPMWWAFENRRQDIVRLLINHGVSYEDKDKYGLKPVDLLGTKASNDDYDILRATVMPGIHNSQEL